MNAQESKMMMHARLNIILNGGCMSVKNLKFVIYKHNFLHYPALESVKSTFTITCANKLSVYSLKLTCYVAFTSVKTGNP